MATAHADAASEAQDMMESMAEDQALNEAENKSALDYLKELTRKDDSSKN